MVDLVSAGAAARLKLFSMRATPKARVEAIEVIERHIGARDGTGRPKAPSAQLVMEF
jgi:hypothetical protein